MIVVIGVPAWRPSEDAPGGGSAIGLAVDIACAAAAAGARVELVGKAGDDSEGDALLVDLARAGVGHAALLRDAGLPTRVDRPAHTRREALALETELASLLTAEVQEAATEPSNGRAVSLPGELALGPADLELALRYLIDFRVLVATEDLSTEGASVVAEAATFAGAHVIAIVAPGGTSALIADATVVERPAEDPDREFARLVAGYATALDRGEAAETAFRAAVVAAGWEPAR